MTDRAAILRRGFSATDLRWKIQSCGKGAHGIWARVVPYVDARAVIDRLDEAFGPFGYGITYDAITVGQYPGVKCRISAIVDGVTVVREDVSDPSDIEPLKGAASGALKRAFVQFGGGAYLYDSPDFYAVVNDNLRSGLPHRGKLKATDGGTAFTWGLPSEAFEWMATTSGQPAPPTQTTLHQGSGAQAAALDQRDARAPQSAGVAPAGDVPLCPTCRGAMYDNRRDKKNPRSPDFKCKTKSCGHAIWLDAAGATASDQPSDESYAPLDDSEY